MRAAHRLRHQPVRRHLAAPVGRVGGRDLSAARLHGGEAAGGDDGEQVIALGCAGPTVVHGLLKITPPPVGDVIVVQGAGPVGLASAMYANLAGAAKVVLVGGPASRLELALDLGACDMALDIFQVPDAAERTARVLAETTAGRGEDLT